MGLQACSQSGRRSDIWWKNVWHKEEHSLLTTQGKLVKLSPVLVGSLWMLPNCSNPDLTTVKSKGMQKQGFTGVFSVGLGDSFGFTVCKFIQRSSDAVWEYTVGKKQTESERHERQGGVWEGRGGEHKRFIFWLAPRMGEMGEEMQRGQRGRAVDISPPGHVCINRGLHPSERASGRRLTHTDRGEQTQR